MTLAAADVDLIWLFILATLAFGLSVVVIVQTFRATPLLAFATALISFAGMLAWWP